MARITDLNFYFDDGLKKKADLIISRVTKKTPKKDAVMLIEGGEGEGKTNLAFQFAYYFKCETGRAFDNSRVFFKAEKLLKYAQETEEQIIIYDEPALDMLSQEWWKVEQINIIKLLMTARKKRHIIIFNITKFYKFNEYLVVDRAICLVHVYSRNEIEPGHFVYIRKKSLEFLYNCYKSSKKRKYKDASSLRGTFCDYVPGILDMDLYEDEKDKAIMSIGSDKKETKTDQKLKRLMYLVSTIPMKQDEMAGYMKMSRGNLSKWKEYKKYDISEEE